MIIFYHNFIEIIIYEIYINNNIDKKEIITLI
jgi:hypothetical protein